MPHLLLAPEMLDAADARPQPLHRFPRITLEVRGGGPRFASTIPLNRSLAGRPKVTKAEPTYWRVPISPIRAIFGVPGLRWTPRISISLSMKVFTFSQLIDGPLA